MYTQPGCQPCRGMKKALDRYGIPYQERDVQQDPAALAQVVEFYEHLTDGRRPQTPVVVIDNADGHGSREILLGLALDDLKALVRDGRVCTRDVA
ncbi:hypothetical protein GCM10027289_29880 [Tsukamurella serpentis]